MRWAEAPAMRKHLQGINEGDSQEGGLGAVIGAGLAGIPEGEATEAPWVSDLGEGVSLGPEGVAAGAGVLLVVHRNFEELSDRKLEPSSSLKLKAKLA